MQTWVRNRKAYYLTLGLLFQWGGLGVWAILPFGDLRSITGIKVPHFAHLLYISGYFLIYLHFEEMIALKPDVRRLFYMSSLFGIGIIVNSLHLTISTSLTLISTLGYFFHDLVQISCFLFALYVSYNNCKATDEIQSKVELLAFSVLSLGSCFSLVIRPIAYLGIIPSANFSIFDIFIFDISDSLLFLGIAIFVLLYARFPNYLYRMPIPMYHILLFNKSGLVMYSRSIRSINSKSPPIQEHLFSNVISAINALLTEMFESYTILDIIGTKDKSLLFENDGNWNVLLICQRPTTFTQKSLKYFIRIMRTMISEELKVENYINVSSADLDKIDGALSKAFPYVKFIDRS